MRYAMKKIVTGIFLLQLEYSLMARYRITFVSHYGLFTNVEKNNNNVD